MRKMKRKKGMIFVEEAWSCLLEFHQQFVEELNQLRIDGMKILHSFSIVNLFCSCTFTN
ncbi:hypothetical protein Hanom_Chr01g00038551 [Helianthus anomalus]